MKNIKYNFYEYNYLFHFLNSFNLKFINYDKYYSYIYRSNKNIYLYIKNKIKKIFIYNYVINYDLNFNLL